jgi:hypothetical protein
MKRFDRIVMRRYTTAAAIFLAVLAWPSEGWPRTTRRACDVTPIVNNLLTRWAAALAQSSSKGDPNYVVETYEKDGAVLLPTCANGPLIGRVNITPYFTDFIKDKPVVEIDRQDAKIGGVCGIAAFASGLYTFKLNGGAGPQLRARYTFVYQLGNADGGLITQHHSSLEPVARPGEARSECPSH